MNEVALTSSIYMTMHIAVLRLTQNKFTSRTRSP